MTLTSRGSIGDSQRRLRSFKLSLAAFFSLLFLLCGLPRVWAQDEAEEPLEMVEEAAIAYTYLKVQERRLDEAAVKYPDLKASIDKARSTFAATDLGKGAAQLEAVLKEETGEDWPQAQKYLQANIAKAVAGEKPLTRESSERLIVGVQAQGGRTGMPETIRTILLALNPAFKESPAPEMAARWRQLYLLEKFRRSEDCDVSIEFPMSWTKRDGVANGVVHVFRSVAGSGRIVCVVYCKKATGDSEPEVTEEKMKELFSNEKLEKFLPRGSKLVEARPMTIAGKPGGLTVYDSVGNQVLGGIPTRTSVFHLAHKRHLVQFQFTIMTRPDEKLDLGELQKDYFPGFQAIMDTAMRK